MRILQCGHMSLSDSDPYCAIRYDTEYNDCMFRESEPDLTLRVAQCVSCNTKTRSNLHLNMFEYRPDQETDLYYCGCLTNHSIYPDTKKKAVICPWTGGADSTFAVYLLLLQGYEVYPYHITYSSFCNYAERQSITEWTIAFQKDFDNLNPVKFIYADLPMRSVWTNGEPPLTYPDKPNSYFHVPARNLVLDSIGVSYAESLQAKYMSLPITTDQCLKNASVDATCDYAYQFRKICDLVYPALNLIFPIWDINAKHSISELIRQYPDNMLTLQTGRCYYPRQVDNIWVPCGHCIPCSNFDKFNVSL